MINVGTNSSGYPEMRNFAGLPFADVHFRKIPDLFKIDAYFHFKFRRKIVPEYAYRFNDLALGNVQLYHFFNTITPRHKPWIVTFETTLPRLDPYFRQGYKWMAGHYCKKIIAISERAFKAQSAQLSKFPEYAGSILPKMMVISPSQPLFVKNIDDKPKREKIVVTFVGAAFYRKGGVELLRAFCNLKYKGAVHLNVVSRLDKEGYMDEHATKEVEQEIKSTLASHPDITYYNSLDNRSVSELFLRSDVGILPSYAETYGYTLLEAMACGCAVASTDMSPFPEFVSNDWGWLVNIPKVERGGVEYPDVGDDKRRMNFSAVLTEQIKNVLERICESRDELRNRQRNAIEAIRRNHDPAGRVTLLRELYGTCILEKNK